MSATTKAFQCHQKLEDQCGCGTLLIYLPKANVTSIWHLAGGNTGPGWQEMNAALHHNEFMAHGQVALCMCKWNHNEKKTLCLHTFCSTHRKPGVMVHRTGNHSSLALGFGAATTVGNRSVFLSIQTLESYCRHLVNPCCPDGIGPSRQHTHWPVQGSGSRSPTGRSTNWPCQRPARTQRTE